MSLPLSAFFATAFFGGGGVSLPLSDAAGFGLPAAAFFGGGGVSEPLSAFFAAAFFGGGGVSDPLSAAAFLPFGGGGLRKGKREGPPE